MSLVILNNPTTAPTNTTQWERFLAREDVSNIGNGSFIRTFILSNWNSGTLKPVIKQGSIIEVGGSIYQADSDTAIVDDPGGLADGQIRIKLVPDSAISPTLVNPYFVNDALPAWDAQKGGWYSSDDKYLPFEMTRASSGTVFSDKFEYDGPEALVKRYASGGVYFPGSAEIGGNVAIGGGASVGGALSMSGALSGVTSLSMAGALSGVTDLSASGSVTADSVTSGSSALKWKTFSGTTDSSGDAVFAHGITGTIAGIAGGIYNVGTSGTWWGIGFFNDISSPPGYINAGYDGANINISSRGTGGGSSFQNAGYNIVVFYI